MAILQHREKEREREPLLKHGGGGDDGNAQVHLSNIGQKPVSKMCSTPARRAHWMRIVYSAALLVLGSAHACVCVLMPAAAC